MASMGGGYLNHEPLVRKIKSSTLLNDDLRRICGEEGLTKTGVKLDLQTRLVEQITKYSRNNNAASFNRLKYWIEHPKEAGTGSSYSIPYPPAFSGPGPNGMAVPHNTFRPPHINSSMTMGSGISAVARTYVVKGNPRIEFKSSPFYVVEEQLNMPAACEIMAQHRHTVKIILSKTQYQILHRVEADPSLRVMVFCAADGHGLQDVAFPHQSEIKVNGGEIKANLRGLKNKPGSTRPVDITQELRLNGPAAYQNSVEMTYALTSKRFYLILYVVKAVPVMDLVKVLEMGKRITEDSVVSTMINKSRDADIVTTASVLSLKCPLSTLRIDLPCRSVACKHNQCFDATSYLQLQEQGPTWLCPICNNPAVFENLAVDEYVKKILKSTSKSIDQVTIQPDGKWELHVKATSQSAPRSSGFTSDSDDDLVEITKTGDSIRMGTPKAYSTQTGTHTSGNRDQLDSPGIPRESSIASGKRSRPAVIDLTSSGDEDDEPLTRPPKRQYTSTHTGAPSNVPVYRPAPTAPSPYNPRP